MSHETYMCTFLPQPDYKYTMPAATDRVDYCKSSAQEVSYFSELLDEINQIITTCSLFEHYVCFVSVDVLQVFLNVGFIVDSTQYRRYLDLPSLMVRKFFNHHQSKRIRRHSCIIPLTSIGIQLVDISSTSTMPTEPLNTFKNKQGS